MPSSSANVASSFILGYALNSWQLIGVSYFENFGPLILIINRHVKISFVSRGLGLDLDILQSRGIIQFFQVLSQTKLCPCWMLLHMLITTIILIGDRGTVIGLWEKV